MQAKVNLLRNKRQAETSSLHAEGQVVASLDKIPRLAPVASVRVEMSDSSTDCTDSKLPLMLWPENEPIRLDRMRPLC